MAVRDGKIERYQIIAPTTWNFSPRDSFDVGGPLVGTDVGDAGPRAVAIQHIARSFDPFMVCTSHRKLRCRLQIELFPLLVLAASSRTVHESGSDSQRYGISPLLNLSRLLACFLLPFASSKSQSRRREHSWARRRKRFTA
ncbi:hypothetical protein ABIC01_005642 [Bradyrhizobium sp. RT4b]